MILRFFQKCGFVKHKNIVSKDALNREVNLQLMIKEKEFPDISIREANIEDAHIIAKAEREIAQQPGLFCSQPSELTDEKVITTLHAFAKEKLGRYLVAEYQGQIVGHAFLESSSLQSLKHIADLNIAVHLGWQNKGVGTKLLDNMIEWAKTHSNLEKIHLNVRATNHIALSLYKKMGFQEEGRLKNRVKVKDGYIDDVIMGLELHQSLSDYSIRKMQPLDIPPLVETFTFSWSSHEATLKKWTEYFAEQKEGKRVVYVIEKERQLVGYASLLYISQYPLFRERGIPEIHDVWIHEEFRQKGFGKLLILHLEKIARKEKYQRVGLGVGLYQDYGPAQILYSQLGYLPDGHGITYKTAYVVPGNGYPVDDELILWLTKSL